MSAEQSTPVVASPPRTGPQRPPPRVFSGMQPTGKLHLGNWLGALKTWVDLIEESKTTGADNVFCIVDQHALSADYDPKELRAKVAEAALYYVAAGVDPTQCTLFVQSHVPAHTELAWYFNTITPMGELSRMTQFKEKSAQHGGAVGTGVLTYPLLMAADILLYRSTIVPVGEDQVQHLELTREIARKWNARFTPKRSRETFPEPQPRLSVTPRIMGIDGQHKMSKSRGNDIAMLEDDRSIAKKLKSAFTDPQRITRDISGNPAICNIFTLHKAVSSAEQVAEIDRGCRDASWGCGDCKELLGKNLSTQLTPIRERARELEQKPDVLLDALADGARRCRTIADETMREVRDRMGLLPMRP
ncbi:MAG: tryptophan--tRNA ligase [Polyangiales bacterium]